MNKMMVICLMVVVGIMMSSCKKDDIVIDHSDYTVTTYAKNFNVSVTRSDNPDFEVSITDIHYSPLTQNICVTYDFSDDYFVNATYFVAMQKRSTWISVDSRVMTLSDSEYHGQTCFYVPDSIEYRIIIGKLDLDTLPQFDGVVNGSIWVDFDDPDFDSRKYVEYSRIINQSVETPVNLVYSKIEYRFEFDNPDHLIDNITVELLTMGKVILEQHSFDIDEICNLSSCLIDTDIFDHLSPYVDYQIVVKASGNDLIDDFENQVMASKTIRTPVLSYWGIFTYESHAGLYGVITGLDFEGEDILVSYYYKNNNSYIYFGTTQTVQLKLATIGNDLKIANTYNIDTGFNVLRIPKSELENIISLVIVDEKDQKNFHSIPYISFSPIVNLQATQTINLYNFDISFTDESDFDKMYENIIIEVFIDYYVTPIERIEIIYPNQKAITLYHDFSEFTYIYLKIYIDYDYLGEKHTMIKYERVHVIT